VAVVPGGVWDQFCVVFGLFQSRTLEPGYQRFTATARWFGDVPRGTLPMFVIFVVNFCGGAMVVCGRFVGDCKVAVGSEPGGLAGGVSMVACIGGGAVVVPTYAPSAWA
jgi:hypothetical protein